jgi:hypothetical protein
VPIPPGIYLEIQIKRLLLKVGNVTRAQLRREKWPGGRGHQAQAMLLAREALESGDDDRMREAVPFCLALERTGNEVSEAAQAKSLRCLGGKQRGLDQTGAATKRWKPYLDHFETLKHEGKSIAAARKIVKAKMVRDEFDPFPSARTIAKWLK